MLSIISNNGQKAGKHPLPTQKTQILLPYLKEMAIDKKAPHIVNDSTASSEDVPHKRVDDAIQIPLAVSCFLHGATHVSDVSCSNLIRYSEPIPCLYMPEDANAYDSSMQSKANDLAATVNRISLLHFSSQIEHLIL